MTEPAHEIAPVWYAFRTKPEQFRGLGATTSTGSSSAARWVLGAVVVANAAATGWLARALLANDFSWAYVADFSRRDTSGPYRLAALWGGMAGSLLWFATLVGVVGWFTARRSRHDPVTTRAVVTVTLALVLALDGLVLAFTDPFARLDTPALDGRGLTPILEHPAMVYHPPLLYLGLASLTAPFALTMAGQSPAVVRRWLLVPWTLLAVGMVAGAHWAYVELGWGGYWAWDPVENTALLPWLATTLAIHASLPGEPDRRRGFAALVCLAFLLALTGTMLTRSGAVPSVHAFAEDRAIGRGLAVLVGLTALAILLKLSKLLRFGTNCVPNRSNFVVLGHFAVVGAVLAVTLVGTVAPLVSDLTGGDGLAIEGRYFARFVGPLAAVGLALVAVVPLARGTRSRVAVAVLPVGAALGVAMIVLGGGHMRLPPLLLAAAAGAALVSSGVNAGAMATGNHARTGRRRIAGSVAHAGLGLFLLGVAGTATGRTESVSLRPGERFELLGETVAYSDVGVEEVDGRSSVVAEVEAAGRSLRPTLVAHPERSVLLAETSLVSLPRRDIQVALRNAQDDGTAVLEVGVHPLQVLVWWGALVLVAAGVLSAWEHRRLPRARPAMPSGDDRGRLDETGIRSMVVSG
jgi:cytochrome c-type biogenesis protein CcmF